MDYFAGLDISMDETHVCVLDREGKAGSEFDRDYIRYEIEGHRKLLDIQEVYLKSPDNLDQANVAKLARGMIKEHLVLLTEGDKAA